MIRPAKISDLARLMQMIEEVGLFAANELEEIQVMLSGYFAGTDETNFWAIDEQEGRTLGVVYYAAERMAHRTWNLYLIAVHPLHRRIGLGRKLLQYVENELIKRGERLLLVETSGLDSFEATREFYRTAAYDEEARIRDFYKDGDDKVVFRKALVESRSERQLVRE